MEKRDRRVKSLAEDMRLRMFAQTLERPAFATDRFQSHFRAAQHCG